MANEFKVKNGLIVIGDLTTSGTITINGALAATQSWVTSQAYLTSASLSGYATQSYVTSALAALVDAAPAALDTLNELAAALGDDANFSTTITNSIASKLPLAGGTMSGILTFSSAYNAYIYTFSRVGLANQGRIIYNNGTGSNMFFGELASNVYGFTPSAYTDTPALAFNFSTNNVGIGTASPTRKLDVNGTSIFRDFTTVVSSNGNPVSNTTWLSTDSGITNIYTGGNSTVQLNSNGVSYFNGGNVGIGTSSPDTPLVVQGGSAGTGGWNRTATLSATYPGLIFNSNGTKWGGMAYDYSAAMRFWVNANNNDIFAGTQAMSILNNGNVGIATSNPIYKLQVAGSAYVNGGTLFLDSSEYLRWGNSNQGIVGVNDSHVAILSGGATRQTIYAEGRTYFPGLDLSISNINGSHGSGTYFRGDGSHFVFGLSDGNTLYLNYGNSSGILRTFGTWYHESTQILSTSRVLTNVSGNISMFTNNAGYLTSETDTLASVTARGASTSTNITFNGTITANSSIVQGYGTILTGYNSGFQITVNATYSGGQTNTYTPQYAGGASAGMFVMKQRNGGEGIMDFYGKQSGTDGSTQAYSTFNHLMTMLPTGNVGIGNTNPSYKLDVVGEGKVTGKFRVGGAVMLAEPGTGVLLFGSEGGNQTAIYSASAEAIRINTAGLVGIGTTTPQKKLDVFGSAGILASFGSNISPGNFAGLHFGYSESYASNDNYKKSALVFERTDNNNHGSNASGKIHFLLNNSLGTSANALTDSVVTIDSDANGTVGSVRMGIGTRNPSTPLHVVGIVQVEGGGSTTFYGTDGSGSYARNFGTQLYTFRDTGGSIITTINTTSGVITTTGGNSTQWNTAYGWGNHATAGYLTSVSDVWVNTTGDTMTGSLTFASTADNVRIQKNSSFLNLRDPYNNIHLYNAGDGTYIDASVHFWRSQAGSHWVALDSTGLGIGTTSPTQKLHVVGNQYITGTITVGASGNNSNVNFVRGDGSGVGGIGWRSDGTFYVGGHLDYGPTAGNRVRVYGFGELLSLGNSQAGDILNITTSGTVGIGTTSPSAKLHVEGSSSDGVPVFRMNGTTAPNAFNYAGSLMNSSLGSSRNTILLIGKAESNRDSGYIGFNHSGTNSSNSNFLTFGLFANDNILNITGAGNVGIGTTAPAEEFHVLGRAIFDGGSGDSSTDAVVYVTKSNNNDWGLYINAAALDYAMYARVSPSAGYALTIHNGTTWTTRITGNAVIYLGEKNAIEGNYDTWLRLNNQNHYVSGVYTPGVMRADGGFNVSGSTVWHAGNDGSGSGLDADLLDGQNSTEFLRLLSGGAEASLDSYTDNGIRSVNFTGHSQHLLSWNAGGSTGTVQQLFHYGTANNGWRIRNKTDNSSWSDWGYVVMASSNQGLISGTIATQSWVGSQSYATTSYVTTQINNLVNGAPGALDTLNELATALGNDASFSTTVTNSIAGKVSKAGDTITGKITFPPAVANRPQFPGGILGLDVGDGNFDIWGISRDYYPSHPTPSSAYGLRWNGDNNDFEFVGAGANRVVLDMDAGNLTIAGFLTESSSLKLKENVETSEGNLEKVVNLRPVTYNKIGSQTTELGLIAEEVAEVYPEFVQYDENGEPVGVNYSRLTAALIGAVKELTNQVQELNKKING